MRILAIRGQNLASLARTFEIDFARGPLAGAGIFAITGPVGAGKSTLLDALCLPLFDRTPRLSGRGGAPVGDDGEDPADWLRANDPRTLLRRDAAAGHAEVDFVGRDGVRYRASWSVRRARRRPDGRVQEQELQLADLDRGIVVACGRRSEVLAAIQQRLGLDFAQFCRSVLLAQGDFAAFLRASADERAKLLETLTGADVYRRLSKAAHERARAGEREVAVLRAQLAAHAPMLADARTALEVLAGQLDSQRATCQVAIELASRYVTWHDAAERHREGESEATVLLQAAVEAHEEAETRRQQLDRQQRALAVVPRWEVATHAAAAAAAAEALAAAAAARRRTADARSAAAAQRLCFELQQAFGAGASTVPAIVRELPQWEPLLLQWQRAEANLAIGEQRLPERERAAAQARLQHERLVAEAAAVAPSLVEAAAAVEAAHAAAERVDRRGLAAARSRLAALREQSARLRQLAEAWRAAADAAQRCRVRGTAMADDGERLLQLAHDAQQARNDAAAACRRARDRNEALRLHAGLADHRARLVAGEPCPLCGATTHAPGAEPVPGDLAAAAAEQAASERELAESDVRLARARGDEQANRRELERAGADLATADAALAAAGAAFRAAAAEAGVGDAAARWADAVAQAAACEQALALESESVLAEEARAGTVTTSLQTAVKLATAANAAWQQVEQRRQQANHAELAAARARDELVRAIEQERARIDDLGAALGGACAGLEQGTAAVAALGSERIERLRRLQALEQERHEAARATLAAQGDEASTAAAAARATADAGAAELALAKLLAIAAVAAADVAAVAAAGADGLAAEAQALRALADEVDRCRTVLRERVSQRRRHEDHERPSLDAADAAAALHDARANLDLVERRSRDARVRLGADDLVRRQRDELTPRLAAAEGAQAVWQALDGLIGSSTGDQFAVFAQALTLDLLLLEANRRLAELARRYRLQKNPEAALDFVVVDLDLGGSRRSLQTLSGGETFLVSLALALALATLAAPKSRVETLFLDEGFGTLDAASLEVALGALDSLQATGCQVGVISHVDGIAERIGAQVVVQPEGGGQSRVFAQAR